MRRLAFRLVFVLSGFLLMFSACGETDSQPSQTARIFVPDRETEGMPEAAMDEAVLRFEYVLLHQAIAAGDAIREGDSFRLELFDDVRTTARVTRVDERLPGVRSFRASFTPPDSGHVMVSVQDKRAAGTIEWWDTGRRFHLRFDPDLGRHYVMEVDPTREDRIPGGDPGDPGRN